MAPTPSSFAPALEPRRYYTHTNSTPIFIGISVLVGVILLIVIACAISRNRTMRKRRRQIEIAKATKFTPTGMVDSRPQRESTMMRGAVGGMSTRSRDTTMAPSTTEPPPMSYYAPTNTTTTTQPPATMATDSTMPGGPTELPAAETKSPHVQESYTPYRPPPAQGSSYPPAPEQLGTETSATAAAGPGQRKWWGLREPERAVIS